MRARMFSVWAGAARRLFQSGAGEGDGGTVISPARWIAAVEPEPADLLPGRLMHEARAAQVGFRLPEYRTVADLVRAVAACEAAIGGASAIETVVAQSLPAHSGRAPALAPDDAAKLFVEHLRCLGGGQYGNDDLTRIYTDHCTTLGVDEVHQNVLREAMKYLPGVVKRQIDGRSESGKRRREYVWDVSAALIKRAA